MTNTATATVTVTLPIAAAAVDAAALAQSVLDAAMEDRDVKRAYAMRALAPLTASPDYSTRAGKFQPTKLANALIEAGATLHVNMLKHYANAAIVYLNRMGADLDALAALGETLPDEREKRAAAKYWDDLNRERRAKEREKREAQRAYTGDTSEGLAGRASATEETETGASAPMVAGAAPSWMDAVGLLARLAGTVPGEDEVEAVRVALLGALDAIGVE